MEHKDIIDLFDKANDYWRDDYERGREDYDFAFGDQWDEGIRDSRLQEGRPCLTENRLIPYINSVVNNIRQTRPQVIIKPSDSDADIETAEILEGLIRNIQNQNDAESVYDMAAFNAVAGAIGWIVLGTKYADETSFDQEITINRVLNPYSVYIDPDSKRADFSDAEFGVEFDEISTGDFKEQYPDATVSSFEGSRYNGDWFSNDSIRIARVYVKEYDNKKLCKFSVEIMGTTQEGVAYKEDVPEGAEIIEERQTEECRVMCYEVNGVEILDSYEFPSKYIPLIPVVGYEAYVDLKRQLYTLIHQAKDPQRMFNYWKTASTEVIALQPKAPWIIADEQVEGYTEVWKSANRSNTAFLPYKAVSKDGVMLPLPQRQPPPTSSGGMMHEALAAADGIKAALGMYDASMGQTTPDISGKAIISRQMQGDNMNFHFVDNLSTAMKHVGRVLVDMIPRIYTGKRIVRVLGQDGAESLVALNQMVVKGRGGYSPVDSPEDGARFFKLGTGKYDVTVEVGAAYATKRQEAANAIIELSKADPRIMDVAGDLLIKNLDIPEGETLVKRIQSVMNPEILAEDVEAQRLVAMSEQLSVLQEQLDQAQIALQVKEQDSQFDKQVKIQELENDRMKIENDTLETRAKVEKILAEANQKIPAESANEMASAIEKIDAQMQDMYGAIDMMLSEREHLKATSVPETDDTKPIEGNKDDDR